MCGIAGFIDPDAPPELRREAVEAMCLAMANRGPDDSGQESQGAACIGMRRLAIFDPANGRQPMRSPDGRLTLVFNGAIYNFRELRAELADGWSFRTECDTEVLLAAFQRWGAEALGRLRGMFAFAAWDAAEQSLFAARDPFGIKPLYYHHQGGRLLFASEIRALLASRAFPAAPDPAAVGEYLSWLSVPAPRTIYRGVRSLRPGECLTLRGGRLEVRSYWSFRSIPDARPARSHAEFVGQLRERLDDTIRAHVLADVPVGAFLSGGLDSAVVAGLMTRAAGGPLRTFSIGFDEAGYSEADAAAASAAHFGAEHHASVLTGREVARDLESILATYDQPTGDGLNTYYVSQAAHAGGIKVALSGLGGDELFGGYPSFRNLPRLARWLPWWRALPGPLREALVARLRRGDTRRHKLADMLRHARDLSELASMQRRVFSELGRRSLLSPDAPAGEAPSPFHPELGDLREDLAGAGPLETASAWELRTYMADVLLRDSDVMSMRHSLELRVPFVDRPLVEWLWRQPEAFKYGGGQPKQVLAEAAGDVIPPALMRRRKHGFALPFPLWMRAELKPFLDETFSDSSVSRSGLFEVSPVQSLWRGFLRHEDSREWSRVWSLAILIAFVNRPIETPRAATTPPVRPRPAEPAPAPRTAPAPRRPTAPVPAPEPAAKAGPPPSLAGMSLLAAPELFSLTGGIPRILQIYLRALCDLSGEQGKHVRMIALNDPTLDSNDVRRCGAENLDNWLVCGRDKVRFVRGLLKMSRGCDRIICGHVFQLPVAWLAKLRRPRLRYYLVAHGIEVWEPFSLAERLALRGASGVFCVSDYTRRELLKHCPLKEGRALVLPNALDPCFEIGPRRPLEECPPVIVTVTRLCYSDRYKGVEHLVEAMPAVRAAVPGAELRVIGRGDDLPRLQSLARRHGVLGAGVEFLGQVDDRRLSEELSSCRLFALPSRKEGFGLVFLEAMAHGRPCLGADAGGIPEVITPETGVLTPFGDISALAAACADALRRPWRSEAMLDRARHFNYDNFKARLVSLLQE